MDDIQVGVNPGDRAPEFRLASNKGGEVGLEDFRGKSAVALFFVREYI